MTKLHNKSRNQTSKSLLTGSILALLIAAAPYIFYSYDSFPQVRVWETFLFTYEANWYDKVSVSVWTMLGKFVPLYLLIIWFLTCKHWWFHVILIPIGMFAFQLFSVINDDASFTDVVEIWWLFPIMVFIVPLVYLTRAKLFNKILGDDLEEFEKDLLKEKSVWQQIRDLFR